MKTVVYADILIIINIIVNYTLLKADSKIIGCDYKAARLLLSAFAGSIYSLIIFVDSMSVLLNVLLKIIVLSAMIIIAFPIKSFRYFFKHVTAFFASNFIFGGIMLAVNSFLLPNKSIYHNGIVYFDIDIFTLAIGTVVSYFILSVINRFIKNKTPPKSIYPIKIYYNQFEITGKALFDSGNTLCDCFSGKPVIIAEKDFIAPLLNGTNIENAKKFRLIPFSTIKDNGTLPAFMIDKISVFIHGKWEETSDIYIGVTDKKIVSAGYSALMGSPFFNLISDRI